MIKANVKFLQHFANTALDGNLHPGLSAIVSGGFKSREGCYLLSAILPKTKSVSRENFVDQIAYECFVNSINIDYDVGTPAAQAIQLVEKTFDLWRKSYPEKTLVTVVSVDEDEFVVKFHLKREGQTWLNDDLESYLDGVLLAESGRQTFIAELENLLDF